MSIDFSNLSIPLINKPMKKIIGKPFKFKEDVTITAVKYILGRKWNEVKIEIEYITRNKKKSKILTRKLL